ARDLRAPQPADELLALAAEHAAADHFDPTDVSPNRAIHDSNWRQCGEARAELGARLQTLAYGGVDLLAVDDFAGEAGHRLLHDPAHVLGRRGARGAYRLVDDGCDLVVAGGRREVLLDHFDPALFLAGQVFTTAAAELL